MTASLGLSVRSAGSDASILSAEERFEVSGDEMERHLSLSLGEPEQLRRAMTPASEANLYVGDATPGSFGEGDEQMEAPPDDMFPQLDSAARPPSVQVCFWSGFYATDSARARLTEAAALANSNADWAHIQDSVWQSLAVKAIVEVCRGHLTCELQYYSGCMQEDDMHVDTSFEAPIPDDLGGNLDDLLPDTAENQG